MTPYDIIVKNGTILTMDSDEALIPDGVLGIKGETIHFIGTAADFSEAAKKPLMPGAD